MPRIARHPGAAADDSASPVPPRAFLSRVLVLTALVACLSARSAPGAILVDSVSSAGGDTASLTWSHTVGSGADRVLVVGVSHRFSNRTVTGVTYGGAPLSMVGIQKGDPTRVTICLWILVNPSPGTANVVVTIDAAAHVVAGAASFTGVYQAAPVGSFFSAMGTSAVASVTGASAPGEVLVGTVAAPGNALSIGTGAGQTSLWSLGTGTTGADVIGEGSTAPGAASVTMSWALGVPQAWAAGVATLRPVRVFPDTLIKLGAEPASAYLADNVYEATAATQVKLAGVMSGATAVYNVQIQNDGNMTGDIRVTGTAGGAGFSVRYLDETSTDRTAAVTGGGYVIAGVPAGGSRTWTLHVTPSGAPAPVPGGSSYNVFVTAVSVADPAYSDQVEAVTSSISANLTMLKVADKATARPGEVVTYSVTVSNGTGLSSASTIAVTEAVPANAGFRIGTATFAPGTSTLTAAVSYSSDNAATWTYSPSSGGCSAPVGYDDCVTHVRWTMSGSMPTGTNFAVGLAVRIR